MLLNNNEASESFVCIQCAREKSLMASRPSWYYHSIILEDRSGNTMKIGYLDKPVAIGTKFLVTVQEIPPEPPPIVSGIHGSSGS